MRPWLRQTRVRLALAYSGVFSLVALVAAAALWLALASIEYSAIDDSLAAQARTLEAGLPSAPAVATGADDALGIRAYVFDGNGSLLQGSPTGAAALGPVAARAAAGGQVLLETRDVEGQSERVRAHRVELAGGQERVLVLARPLAETNRVVSTTALVLLLGMAMLIIAASVLGYGLAQTALRPVREIAATARGFSEENLHRRIELDLPPDELGELADTFNGMLARLERAFDGLRRFTADAAHELRAPLTLVRTEAEVALNQERSPQQYRASLATILSETERMGRLAEQLLLLARVDAGAVAIQRARVDFPALVTETVRLWQPLGAEKEVRIEATVGGEADLLGDPDLLRRMLDNLLDNALRHSPAGSEVSVGCRVADRAIELVVADQGPGVPEAARSSIFERFARGDSARSRHTGGAGLGLALCTAIAGLHDGSITLDEAYSAGARFVVRLPLTTS